ncbi:MAG: type II toxin-antitoxin system RelE/ParE family toxin [Lachnospiraceae bacterium]|nr:type II toxin-antitoxin system RelE/ParE family toxin [uncultured Acetatifactor sp.]MCI8543000.1 type II toxin-antitoxin system RelE/ParE family toxin [Lachnospiraceae bacterium]
MQRTFIQTREFSRNWDRLGFRDVDLRKLELELLQNPTKYPVVEGTGGLRKMRFSFENEGKSGGVRVCYVDFVIEESIYLITVYPKSEKDNLSKAERNEIKKMIELLKDGLRRQHGRSI